MKDFEGNKINSIKRADFIKQLMSRCGLTYVQSCQAYDCLVSSFEDAVLSGSRVSIGRVGALVPVWRPPRTVKMGFRRSKKNQIDMEKREFRIGSRIQYKFNLHRAFMAKHQLRWFC
jgi:nucleoid DNA-binding protein